ncbi:nucleotidyltransferase domain-containing protein [Candidatus Gottesmanbacteria bacterium]|nr:nucleotidyltransferase domain-containing protein [Candidatus Gottesmanbacteria bacterium]
MVKKSILSDSPVRLIKKYRDVLIKNGIKVEKMILFGSYAKGKARPWSDLDVCVVSTNFGKDDYDETILLSRLTSGVDEMIEPHPFHPKDLADPYNPLADQIRKTGKILSV